MIKTEKNVKGESYLTPEAVSYQVETSFESLVRSERGLTLLLQTFSTYSNSEGVTWGDETNADIACCYEILKGIRKKEREYLSNRVRALEEHCGLAHLQDIDI